MDLPGCGRIAPPLSLSHWPRNGVPFGGFAVGPSGQRHMLRAAPSAVTDCSSDWLVRIALTSKGVLEAAVLAMLAAGAASASAEPIEGTHLHAIEVTGTPEGLLGAAGVRMRDATNAELVLDAIEHVHFLNRSPAGVEFYADTVAAFLNEWRRARRRDGTVSLEAAQEDSRARDRLEDFLEAGGFLLLRNSGRLFVRPDPDSDAGARREALAAAGFPTADLDVRMNEGEAIPIEPLSFEIPSPLPAEVWRDAIFDRPVSGERLAFRLLTDRQAAFLYYGLLSMTPETVQFLAADPELLRDLYERDASAFAVYGRSLVVVNGRVRTPGRGAASVLWQRLVQEPIDRPDEFFKAVLRYDNGPFPFLYDAIASLDAPQQRFALGVALEDRDQRRAFSRLYDVIAANLVFAPGTPWPRGFPDPSVLLSQVRADDAGQPSGPAWEDLWDEALDGIELPQNASRDVQGATRSDPIEASHLAERVFREPPWAAARMGAFLFAQRRFTNVETRDLRHVFTTLRGFPFFQSLVSTLDRMGVQTPRTYATAVLNAASLNRMVEPEDARDALSQFQGAVALLDRLRYARSLSEAAAADLAASAAAVRLHETLGFEGRMAAWVARDLAFRPRRQSAGRGHGGRELRGCRRVAPRGRCARAPRAHRGQRARGRPRGGRLGPSGDHQLGGVLVCRRSPRSRADAPPRGSGSAGRSYAGHRARPLGRCGRARRRAGDRRRDPEPGRTPPLRRDRPAGAGGAGRAVIVSHYLGRCTRTLNGSGAG